MRQTMKYGVLALATTLALGACDDGEVTAPESDFSGSFQASTMEFVADGQAGTVVDLMEDGATFTLDLDENNGRFSSSFRSSDVDTGLDLEGEFERVGDSMIMDDDPFMVDDVRTERTFTFTGSENRIVLEGGTGLLFEETDEPVPGNITVELDRIE